MADADDAVFCARARRISIGGAASALGKKSSAPGNEVVDRGRPQHRHKVKIVVLTLVMQATGGSCSISISSRPNP